MIASASRYQIEIDYWRSEIKRRIDEDLMPTSFGPWFEAMVQRIERRIAVLDVLPSSERAEEEDTIDSLIRELTCEASRAIRIRFL